MMNLSAKILEYKNSFDIPESINQEFKLDDKGGLLVKWGDDYRYLTNSRSPNKFLSKRTLQFTRKYGIEFLRALGIMSSKKIKEKKKKGVPLEEQIQVFKEYHNITSDIPELKITDGKLSGYWNGAWFPVSQKNKNKPLANSTLQRRYGGNFLRAYKIPTVKRKSRKKQKEKKEPQVNSLFNIG